MKGTSIFFVALAAAVLAACGGTQPTTKEITLEAKDIAYGVTTLEVTAGQPVKLTLKNVGALDHDFNIAEIPVANLAEQSDGMAGHDMGSMTDAPAVHVATTPGASATIEFTPTKPGAYEFFCATAGHKEAGMIGTLVVKTSN
jgi:uncharacterized cupredoxin-like copper-binding protein